MRLRRMISGLLWIVALASVSEAQRARPVTPEAEIRRLIETFRRGWEENDAEALRRTCAPEVVLVSLGRRDQGIEEVVEHLRVAFQNFPHVELRLDRLQVRPVGAIAWAQAEARYVQKTAHGTSLAYTGYASFLLRRERVGWRILHVDLNVRPMAMAPAPAPSESPVLEGAWLLESARDLKTGRALGQGALLLFTRSRFALVAVAPDRRLPRGKPLSDYSKRELLELLRDVESSVGEYRRDGDRIHLIPVFSLFPEMTGEPQTFENMRLERDRLSVEWEARRRRLLTIWRRVE